MENIPEAQTAKTEETNCASSGGGKTALKREGGMRERQKEGRNEGRRKGEREGGRGQRPQREVDKAKLLSSATTSELNWQRPVSSKLPKSNKR